MKCICSVTCVLFFYISFCSWMSLFDCLWFCNAGDFCNFFIYLSIIIEKILGTENFPQKSEPFNQDFNANIKFNRCFLKISNDLLDVCSSGTFWKLFKLHRNFSFFWIFGFVFSCLDGHVINLSRKIMKTEVINSVLTAAQLCFI